MKRLINVGNVDKNEISMILYIDIKEIESMLQDI